MDLLAVLKQIALSFLERRQWCNSVKFVCLNLFVNFHLLQTNLSSVKISIPFDVAKIQADLN